MTEDKEQTVEKQERVTASTPRSKEQIVSETRRALSSATGRKVSQEEAERVVNAVIRNGGLKRRGDGYVVGKVPKLRGK